MATLTESQIGQLEQADRDLEAAIEDCKADFGDAVGECDIEYEMVIATALTLESRYLRKVFSRNHLGYVPEQLKH
jgi:hypothetical protein